MQVSVEHLDSPLARKLNIALPMQQFRERVQQRVRELGKTIALKGFRPGRVPPQVVQQRYGAQVQAEVRNDLVREALAEALRSQGLRPAGTPSVDAVHEEGDTFAFTVRLEILPEIGPIDLAPLELEVEQSSITEDDVDAMIETLRLQRRRWPEAERPAEAGDLVAFEFAIEAAGIRTPVTGVERAATILGSNAVLSGLEDGLIGARAGEDKTLGVRFPDDYREPALAGQTGTAQVKVLRVQRPELPAVDAEFIASFGISAGTIDDFRREVRANLERELANALSARLRNHVAQRLVERYGQFDVPAGMVDAEARALRSRFWEQARRQGGNVPANAEEIPLDGFLEGARQRVKAGLLLGEIARSNELKVDPKRVQQALLAIASTYEDPTSVIAMYRQDQGLMEALANRVLEEQVAEWIAERANTRRVERSFSEIMRPDAGTT